MQVINEVQPQLVLLDKGGLGMQLAEELEDEFTFVKGVQLTNLIKNNAVTFTKKLMESRNFVFEDDRELIGEFHSVKRNITQRNNISFESPRTKKGHGDRAWAVMLALLAAKLGDEDIKMAFI